MKQTVSFSKRSKNIFFHLLTNCNLKCRHCYINTAQHGANTLPLATVSAWLQAFADGVTPTNLILLGGEPTLHPDLPEVIRTARNQGYQSITIDTNGYLFHDIIHKVAPHEVDFFSFSLDGPTPQENDRIRGRGVFDRCVAGIKSAKQMGFGTSLIYTVSSSNLNGLKDMVPLLGDLAVDRFFFQVIGLRGKSSVPGKDADPRQVTDGDWLNIIPDVARQVAKSGIAVTYPKVYLSSEEAFACAGTVADNYFVFPNGRVYRCPLCEDFPINSLVFENNGSRKCRRSTKPISSSSTYPKDV